MVIPNQHGAAGYYSSMEWSECCTNTNNNNSSGGNTDNNNANNSNNSTGGTSSSSAAAPTIKNHSVTHFGNYLYCFGGYDGRRNHMTLLLYSLRDQRWIRPLLIQHDNNENNTNSSNIHDNTNINTTGNNNNNQNQNNNNSAEHHQPSFMMMPIIIAGDDGEASSNNAAADNEEAPTNNNQQQQQQANQQQPNQPLQNNNPSFLHLLNNNNSNRNNNPNNPNNPSNNLLFPDNMNPSNNFNQLNHNQHNHSHHHPIVVRGIPPPGRNGHSATLAVEDKDNARIIIIGGWLGTGPLAASDLHILNINNEDNNCQQLRWYQPPLKGTPPGPCNMHSADYVSANKEVYVFRGGNGREYLNDLHALNVNTLIWRQVTTTGQIPQQRANHSSAILDETSELFIFGGWNGTQRLNDIHVLDTTTSNWTRPYIGGILPHPRAGMTLTALRSRLYLFGGSGTSAKCFHDLQILDRNEMSWLDVTPTVDNENENGAAGRGRNHGPHNNASSSSPLFASYHNSNNMNNRHHLLPPSSFSSNNNHPQHHQNHQFQQQQQQQQLNDHRNFVQDGSFGYDDEAAAANGQSQSGSGGMEPYLADWQSREATTNPHHHRNHHHHHKLASPNPNDEDTVPSVLVHGHGPGRRAGHTATAVNRKIYIFGGSCGSDYLNDFFVLDTDPSPRATVSEATSLQLLERRLCHFCNDPEFSDVTFVVQNQKVYGHKMVLSIVSDCFRAMFTTGFRESEQMEIEIPDCSYRAFLNVMEYIYTGSIPDFNFMNNNNSGSNDEGNLEHVLELLELADRFFLDHLKQICESMLQPAVTYETVEYLLNVAQKTNAGQLQAICEHFLRNYREQQSGGGAIVPAAAASAPPR